MFFLVGLNTFRGVFCVFFAFGWVKVSGFRFVFVGLKFLGFVFLFFLAFGWVKVSGFRVLMKRVSLVFLKVNAAIQECALQWASLPLPESPIPP